MSDLPETTNCSRSTIKVSKIAGRRHNSVDSAASRGGHFSPEEARLCKSACGLGESMDSISKVLVEQHSAPGFKNTTQVAEPT